MAKIRCEAKTCGFNEDGGCRLETVKIEGEGAETCRDTECDSYTEKGEQSFTDCACSASGCACNHSVVKCDATTCRHNEDCTCTADRIEVGGSCAHCGSETECRTFSK